MSNGDSTISKYDRQRAGLEGVAMFTKPSTIQNIEGITGRAETYVIRTCRHDELGDFVFIECMDEGGERYRIPAGQFDQAQAQAGRPTASPGAQGSRRVAGIHAGEKA